MFMYRFYISEVPPCSLQNNKVESDSCHSEDCKRGDLGHMITNRMLGQASKKPGQLTIHHLL
jgi:hypothetical protein